MGVVSGVPFTWDAPNSLFCFALMQPNNYERELLELQLHNGWSVFGCDEYEIVSNSSVRLHPGVVSSAIDSDLQCELGGEFGTALNTEIFFVVWRKVIENQRWSYHDWTVKARWGRRSGRLRLGDRLVTPTSSDSVRAAERGPAQSGYCTYICAAEP